MPLSATVISASRSPRPPRRGRPRRHALAAELERVGDQVLEQLAHLQRVGLDASAASPTSTVAAGSSIARLEVGQTTSRATLAEVDLLERRGAAVRDARERQQVLDQRLHPAGRVAACAAGSRGPCRQAARRRRRPSCCGEHLHLAQRLLQVVRGDRRELLELGVRAARAPRRGAPAGRWPFELLVGFGELSGVAQPAQQYQGRTTASAKAARGAKGSTCSIRVTGSKSSCSPGR